jgi:hypothetical protein
LTAERGAGPTTRRHLHIDDCPQALAALAATLNARRADDVGLADIGYEATEHGAWSTGTPSSTARCPPPRRRGHQDVEEPCDPRGRQGSVVQDGERLRDPVIAEPALAGEIDVGHAAVVSAHAREERAD